LYATEAHHQNNQNSEVETDTIVKQYIDDHRHIYSIDAAHIHTYGQIGDSTIRTHCYFTPQVAIVEQYTVVADRIQPVKLSISLADTHTVNDKRKVHIYTSPDIDNTAEKPIRAPRTSSPQRTHVAERELKQPAYITDIKPD